MMQRNNLQPQQRQALRVPRNDIIEADEDPNRDHEELINGDEVETEDEDEVHVAEQEEDFEPVKGDLLVVQRVLNAQIDVSDEQRENIFHTRC